VQTQPNQQQSQQANENSSTTSLWVRKFLSARPKDTLLPIPREYLSDGFNLVQLAPIVEKIGRMEGGYVPPAISSDTSFPLFKAALRLILSNDDGPTPLSVQRAAEVLYTLVHARYVISPRGLDTVRSVLRRSDGSVNPVFGRCPRIRCRGMPLIPYGDSDNFDARNSVSTRAKRYCSCCGEKFYMWDSKADESAWGTSFCHLFLMIYGSTVFSDLHMEKSDAVTSTDVQQRIFGFQVHPASQLRYSFGD
jgi:casein kinase II subunit beta